MNLFPFEFKNLSLEEIEKRKGLIPGSYIRVGPKGYLLPAVFKNIANDYYNLKFQPNDVFVVGYCRSGTTWTQELVWLLQNNLDFERANAVNNSERVALLDFCMFLNSDNLETLNKEVRTPKFNEHLEKVNRLPSELIEFLPSPRTIKTHMPLSLLPPNILDEAKVVYICRNPRDVAVSVFKLVKSVPWYPHKKDISFNQFFDFFMSGSYEFTPYFEAVKEAWDKRSHPNMLFLFYEDLVKDLPSVLRRVAKFLDKQISYEDITKMCDYLDIKNMRKNSNVNESFMNGLLGTQTNGNYFVGKGGIGGWMEYFDETTAAKAEKWINDNLQGTDLRFPESQ